MVIEPAKPTVLLPRVPALGTKKLDDAVEPEARVKTKNKTLPNVLPVAPVGPWIPCGIPKLKTAAELDPLLETVGVAPGLSAVEVPTVIVAAAPVAPVGPVIDDRACIVAINFSPLLL